MRSASLAAGLALALVACGDDAAEKQARATLERLDRAALERDYAGYCALHTEAARRELHFCEPDDDTATIVLFTKEPPISDIDVDGDTAMARREGDSEPTRLRKVDGRWLIDSR